MRRSPRTCAKLTLDAVGVRVLRSLKLVACQSARVLGINALTSSTQWRRNRLLILAYHGVSQEDEHFWNSSLYMTPASLQRRMERLKAARCAVLPLNEALQRLSAGELPPRSVALTFDDGAYDFYCRAYPILNSFGFPATVYLTTYYLEFNRPVYDTMTSYLLWKSTAKSIRWPEVLQSDETFDLAGSGRAVVHHRMRSYPGEARLSGPEKDELLCRLAERLEVDYALILKRRLLHIMNASEARELISRGVDFQLHTHRHGVSRRPEMFRREIEDNRRRLEGLGVTAPTHFCYPGGVHRPEFLSWLRECNVVSATTCEPGLATRHADSLLLPRLVDTTSVTDAEFDAWLAGTADFFPKRPYMEAQGQFLEDRFGLESVTHLNASPRYS